MLKITREQKIEALKFARERIKHKRNEFICHALPNNAARDYLKAYIMKALQGDREYSNWLGKKHPTKYQEWVNKYRTNPDYFDNQCRRARLAWIDWMIKNAT